MEALKERLRYDPETGDFFWIKPTGARTAGAKAGSQHCKGYWSIGFRGKLYLAHRLAWYMTFSEWPVQIDHINHDRLDNRLCNLRSVEHVDNGRNQKIPSNNTSGICGVCWDRRRGKWVAGIKVDGRMIDRQRFGSLLDAASHRHALLLKYDFHENHGVRHE